MRLFLSRRVANLLKRVHFQVTPSSTFSSSREFSEHKDVDTVLDATISPPQQWLNLFGCIIAAIVYVYLTLFWSDHLYTFDTLQTIVLAEYCGWSNEKARSRTVRHQNNAQSGLSLAEKGEFSANRLGCIAAVVGYREHPSIYTKALGSYLKAKRCQFILAGIDGNSAEDQVMVDIFSKVYPQGSAVINLPVPLVELALQMAQDSPATQDMSIVEKCIVMAKSELVKNNVQITGPGAITRLCVTQPHMHKKGIMFTSFIFTFAISELLGIKYVWTSDSDSIVYEDTINRTIETINGDEKCAGASTTLNIHNRRDNLITTLGNTIYLNDFHLSRCFSSAVAANDCQSGPCAAFRIKTIKPELLAWYNQTILGRWMKVNEDRHFTTRLLLSGHRVRYIPHAITATETPVTLRRWLLQQVRWARAVHIESYVNPSIYVNQNPLFFYGALRREATSCVIFITMMMYFFLGVSPLVHFTLRDYVAKFLFTAIYLKTRNPINPTWAEWAWSVPAALFYMIPLPAIQAWSFVTMLANDWGTSMRGETSVEVEEKKYWRDIRKKVWEVSFFVVWMGVFGGVVGRYVSSQMGLNAWLTALNMGASSVVMWIGFGYWMFTIEE